MRSPAVCILLLVLPGCVTVIHPHGFEQRGDARGIENWRVRVTMHLEETAEGLERYRVSTTCASVRDRRLVPSRYRAHIEDLRITYQEEGREVELSLGELPPATGSDRVSGLDAVELVVVPPELQRARAHVRVRFTDAGTGEIDVRTIEVRLRRMAPMLVSMLPPAIH